MRRALSNYASIFIVLLLLAGIVGGYFYFQEIEIPNQVDQAVKKIEDSYMASRTTVFALKPEASIEKYTVLTKEIIEENFQLRSMDIANLVPGTIETNDYDTAVMLLEGKLAAYDMKPNQAVTEADLIERATWYEGYERIEDYKFSTIVGDTVRAGDYIDVKVNFPDGTSAIVYSKAKVIAVNAIVDSVGNVSMSIPNPYTVLLNVEDPITSRNLELAEKVGSFEASLYYNEAQTPSEVTFDYEATLEHYKIRLIQKETKVPETLDTEDVVEEEATDEEPVKVEIDE